jgi:hypothetical protein
LGRGQQLWNLVASWMDGPSKIEFWEYVCD